MPRAIVASPEGRIRRGAMPTAPLGIALCRGELPLCLRGKAVGIAPDSCSALKSLAPSYLMIITLNQSNDDKTAPQWAPCISMLYAMFVVPSRYLSHSLSVNAPFNRLRLEIRPPRYAAWVGVDAIRNIYT